MKKKILLLVFFLSFVFCKRCDAVLIDYGYVDFMGGIRTTDPLSIALKFYKGDQSIPNSLVYYHMMERSGDGFVPVTIDSSIGTQFWSIVDVLTDGVNEPFISVCSKNALGSGVCGGGHEAGILHGNNLQGSNIESIKFSIDAFYVSTPATNPNGDGIWTDVAGFSTLEIYGDGTTNLLKIPRPTDNPFYPVPEPSTILLLASGFGGFAILRKFRK